jgi:hypothetical protein
MRRTPASRPATIFLVVLALLVSSAGYAVVSHGEGRAALAATSASGASSSDGAHGLLSDSDGATRTTFVRSASPSIIRGQAPISGRSSDARDAATPGAPQTSLDRRALRAPATVEARRAGVPSPGQPAPASRAPPVD